MPKNEDGEFELILGNKQLLSVFFIVVILLGVFFAMGFIVGRNSPAPATEAASVRKAEVKPLVVDSGQPKAVEPPPAPRETSPQQPAEPLKSDADRVADEKADASIAQAAKIASAKLDELRAKDAREAEARARAADEEKAKKEERARAKKEAKEAKDKAKKESANADRPKPALGTPSGTYLQLAATTQHEAEAMVDMLRKKEFQAITAEVPDKPGIFRVLVGPLADSAIGSSRTELQGKGFAGDKAIKRSF
jgi:hypothetical protein